jgi:hypothetical protein
MPIAVVCSSCQASLKVPDHLAGKQVNCPKCSRPVAASPAAPARIKVTCPACTKVLQAPAQAAGKTLQCPACGQPVRVAATGAATPQPAAVGVPASAGRGETPAKAGTPKAAGEQAAAKAKKRLAVADEEPFEAVTQKASPASRSPKAAPRSSLDPQSDSTLEEMFEEQEVPQQYQDALRKELAKGEEVSWVGRPLMEIRLRQAKVFMVIGIVLGVIALGLIGAGIALGPWVMAVIGGVLVPFSVLFVLVRYLVQKFAGAREVYLVTTRRAILYPLLRSYDRRQLHNKMELRESSYVEGAGSLIFEIDAQLEAKAGVQRPGQSTVEEKRMEYGFKDIANVAAVEKLIRKTILLTKPAKEDESDEDEDGAEVQVAKKVKKASPAVQDDNTKPAPGVSGSWVDADEAEEPPARRKKKVSPEAVEASHRLIEDLPVSERAKDKALNRLDDDEVVLWVGKPLEKLVLLRALLPATITLIIAVVLGVVAINQKAWMGWAAAGALLVAAVAIPIVKRLLARRTFYVLTQRRATVWEPNLIGKLTVCDYTKETLSRMKRRNALFVKGAGDLVFRTLTKITTTHYHTKRRGGGRQHTGSESQVQVIYWGFLAIADVAQVEALINENIVEPYLDKIHE